jgi:regulator of RNase E activity RraA
VFEVFEGTRPAIVNELVEAYRCISPSTLGHIMDGRAMDSGIRPVAPGSVMVGPAVTVTVHGRDSTVCHKVIDLLVPGDVVVISQDGGQRYSCWGEMMALAAKLRGAAGVVIDGPATDVAQVRTLGLPVFARGTSPLTTQLLGQSGVINAPVTCGGVRVEPGELILASDDGVLVLSVLEAQSLLEPARIEERGDEEYRQALLRGELPSQLAPLAELIEGASDGH